MAPSESAAAAMDELRSRIEADLRGLIDGEVRCDEITLQLYASDASIYQIKPLGVVFPRTTEDVTATVRYARENNLPLHARGAGSGLAGESLGPGLVIDFSRHLRRVLAIGDDWVRVQPGVVLDRLNLQLRARGRQFGPDPAMSHVTTLGSVVALDNGGSHWLRYGSARQHVRSLECVLADGSRLELGSLALGPGPTAATEGQERARELALPLAELLAAHAPLIGERQTAQMPNRSGYWLEGVWREGVFHFPRLLAGSEGTLALFTEMTLDTVPLPSHRGLAILLFDRLESAARAAADLLPLEPAACDLMDRRHLSLARDAEPRYDLLIPRETEALLLVEQEGADVVEVRHRLEQIVDRVRRRRPEAFDARLAFDAEDVELFWGLARRVVPTLYRLEGRARPLPFVEDLAVPPERLAEFLVQMQNLLKRHQITASLFGHAGQGQLHLRPFLDLDNPDDVRRMEPLARDLYELTWGAGGTISGEHGDGLSRTQFVREQYGPLYGVFQEVKRHFDPHNVLNPGKKLGDDPHLMLKNLRPGRAPEVEPVDQPSDAAPRPLPILDLELDWSGTDVLSMTRSCNGCGACRTTSADARMCPVFRFAPSEEASPRAKANLLRALLTGGLEPNSVARDDFKAVADLCVNCQMCRLECPAGVDIPKLMIEAKGAYVASNGLAPSDWALAQIDWLGSWASQFAPLANWLIANPRARWTLEKLLGLARSRKLPRYAAQGFQRRARRRRLTRPSRRPGSKVLYFPDTYVNYHDPQLGEALIAVLEHNGVSVFVHPGLLGSGMPMVSLGALGAARRVARTNVRLLAEAIRQGYHIVATEPAAALCLTRHYPELLADDESRLVAENTSEATSYVWQLHRAGRLKLNLRPIHASVGYHLPCHLKALGGGTPGEYLLRLIPALRVQWIERGCSGMAGTYGLKRENFRSSLRAGWSLISSLRHSGIQLGSTECSCCKLQMEQGTNKPTIHPLKLLALSYGLMPEIGSLLTAHSEELVVT